MKRRQNDAVAGQKSNNKSFGGTYLHTYICTIVNDYDETVLRLAPAGPAKSKKKTLLLKVNE